MASVEEGPSGVVTESTALVTPTGSGLTPVSSQALSVKSDPTSFNVVDGVDYGATFLSGGGVEPTLSKIAGAQSTWFNRGWFSSGAVFESWTSTGTPSTTPPSGHTLVDIQSFIVF